MATLTATDTATRILDVAEELVQTRGINAMSYGHVSARVGITNASLHYHFPAKSDLAIALVDRYAQRFSATLADIDHANTDPGARLRAYAGIYRSLLVRGRMCLCGMLASDFDTLPLAVRARVSEFFERNYEWVQRVIDEGVAAGRIAAPVDPRATAQSFVAGLEGAMLLSRPVAGIRSFDAIVAALLSVVGVPEEA